MSNENPEERLLLDKATKDFRPFQGLTVTYSAKLEQFSYKQQYNKTAYTLCRILQKGCEVYEFYPEFTETGRIHYHGRYKTSTKYKSLKMYEELRKTGFIKIETKLGDKWHDYIKKDIKDTTKLIGYKDVTINRDMYERILHMESSRRNTIERFVDEAIDLVPTGVPKKQPYFDGSDWVIDD